MRRRDFVQFLSGAIIAVPCGAAAQAAPKTYQLATLNPRAPITAESPFGSILVRELAQRGYRLGQNLVFDARGADGKIALLPMAGDGTTVIIGSDISNSFNVVRNNDPALADALQTISGAVEKSGNKEAGLAWERFM